MALSAWIRSAGIKSGSNRRGTSLPSSIAVPFPWRQGLPIGGDALALVVAANTCTSTISNENSNDLKLRCVAKFLSLPWLTSNFVSPQLQSPWSSGVVREGTASKLADDVSMAPQLHYGMPAKAHRGSSLSASGGYLQLSLISLTPRPISHQLMLLLEAPRA